MIGKYNGQNHKFLPEWKQSGCPRKNNSNCNWSAIFADSHPSHNYVLKSYSVSLTVTERTMERKTKTVCVWVKEIEKNADNADPRETSLHQCWSITVYVPRTQRDKNHKAISHIKVYHTTEDKSFEFRMSIDNYPLPNEFDLIVIGTGEWKLCANLCSKLK